MSSANLGIGDVVRPLAGKRRLGSYWPKGFAGKKYHVIGVDELDGERVLKLRTGPNAEDYRLVYPTEVRVIVRTTSEH